MNDTICKIKSVYKYVLIKLANNTFIAVTWLCDNNCFSKHTNVVCVDHSCLLFTEKRCITLI